MPIDGGDVSRIQCVEHFQVRIVIRSRSKQRTKLFRPLGDEHRLEGGMAVFGIERLQDEATRLHAPPKSIFSRAKEAADTASRSS
jgi:hypothetical protein